MDICEAVWLLSRFCPKYSICIRPGNDATFAFGLLSTEASNAACRPVSSHRDLCSL
jgi:hypothetical protein